MEFDNNLKIEILENIGDTSSFLAGILSTSSQIVEEGDGRIIQIFHSSYQVVLKIARVVRDLYSRSDCEIGFAEPCGTKRAREYVYILDKRTTETVLKDYNITILEGHLIMPKRYYSGLDEVECRALVQGVFEGCGRVYIPQNDENTSASSYHLEMIFRTRSQCETIAQILLDNGRLVKQTVRRNKYILYIKNNSEISDIIAYMGASGAVVELAELVVERDVRNNINRSTNCVVANIDKSTKAGIDQVQAIKKIDKGIGIATLDEKLRSVAEARLIMPEASIEAISEYLGGTVSKSGIYHRIKKIMLIANEIK